MNGHSDYVRFTPETGHAITDVRFSAFYVRFTPNSGHYSGTPICPFLTHNGHLCCCPQRRLAALKAVACICLSDEIIASCEGVLFDQGRRFA